MAVPPLLPFAAKLAAGFRASAAGGPVVLAVSGGADSTALLRGTLAVAAELDLRPVVAHLDHGLRDGSAIDAAWVAATSRSLGLECVTERIDVRSTSARERRGIEETARRMRYDFLRRTAEDRGAAFVATAHTADDQAETVLFQMLRGSGLRGLRGIPARRKLSPTVMLVRPMLAVTRPEVESGLRRIGQGFLTDESNADRAHARNRLRHDLLPLLREQINPRLDEALRRLARQAAETSDAMRRAARRELAAAAPELSPGLIRLRCDRLRTRPRAIVRETVALAWRRAGWPRQAMGFAHWDGLAGLVLEGGRRTLPGGTDARSGRGELILKRPAR